MIGFDGGMKVEGGDGFSYTAVATGLDLISDNSIPSAIYYHHRTIDPSS